MSHVTVLWRCTPPFFSWLTYVVRVWVQHSGGAGGHVRAASAAERGACDCQVERCSSLCHCRGRHTSSPTKRLTLLWPCQFRCLLAKHGFRPRRRGGDHGSLGACSPSKNRRLVRRTLLTKIAYSENPILRLRSR